MISEGLVYKTKNFGDLIVLSVNSNLDVDVEFVETGYRCKARVSNILSGGVKDRLMPYVFGVGFIGEGKYKSSIDGVETKAYRCWHSMMKRCYSPKEQLRNPSYTDCEVCEDWHNFQNFAKWFYENYPNDGNEYQMDKDIKSGSKTGKLYSPDFCSFVTGDENMKHAHSSSFSVINDSGFVFKGKNIREFSRANGLDHSCMVKVIKGTRKSHKGWRLSKNNN